jgi:hypothetical protein
VILIGVGWSLVAAFEVDGPGGPLQRLGVGYLIGTLFGQAVLAGAWAGLGPLRMSWRLPLSLVWLVALAVALGINEIQVVAPMSLCMLGVWLVSFLCCAALASAYHFTAQGAGWDAQQRRKPLQFGIRQLMVLTAIVAVVLAIGRMLAPLLASVSLGQQRDFPIFMLLGAAAIFTNLPFVLAAFLPARMPLAVGLGVLLGIFWVLLEYQIVRMTYPAPRGPELAHLIWTSLFGGGWALAVPLLLRRGGYRLQSA